MPPRYADPGFRTGLALLALACLVAALYAPFLQNPLVFDDRSFFSGRFFADYASSPFAFELRRPSYFSIAFTQVFSGRIEMHRMVSLGLHAACALALFASLISLRVARLPAFFGAAFFGLHPAAVYAAAYLVQRSMLLATLFSLLSLALFVHGMRRERYPLAVAAAAAYWIAVLSKEHSILLPGAILFATPLATANWHFAARYGALYATCCAPAAILVYLMSAALLGTAYEPALGTIAPQSEAVASAYPAGSAWLASVVAQAALFFRYLGVWLWPDVTRMAIDLPPNLDALWTPGWALLALAAFVGYGAAAGLLLLRGRGWPRLLGYGLLFVWIAFLVEFSSIRFQEPFVLYRSYLWAPGLAVAAAAALARMPRAASLASGIAIIAILFYGATDRLTTFASPLALWEDAARKLPAQPVPGGARTLFNLAREQFYAGQTDRAAATSDACVAKHPEAFYCYFGRGSLRLQQGQFEQALADLERALALQRDSGMAHHHRGVALEGMGRLGEARAEYELARKLSFGPAAYRLRMLDERAQPLSPTRSAAPRPD